MVAAEEYKDRYGFSANVEYEDFKKGLTEDTIRQISRIKGEPDWMLEKRLTGYKVFLSKPTPKWGADLSAINYDDIYYYRQPKGKEANKWSDVPADIKNTFDKLGVPEAEAKFFAGAEAQFDSSVVYSHVNKELERLGIIFTDTDNAVKKYPELMKKYFGTIIPPTDNKFAALNTATWSGGSFIYIPKGVKATMPLNAYFRINAESSGQFERTLIIADEGADVTYIEGCLVKGTKITTDHGKKNIEEIQIGDKVLTHTGKYRKVYHTQVRPYTGKLYTIKYFDAEDITIMATEEHPFLAIRKKDSTYKGKMFKPEWIKTCDLREGDLLTMVIPNEGTRETKSSGDQLQLLTETLFSEASAYIKLQKINIENVINIPVYNFSVEEDESYMAEGIAVHNCTAPVYAKNSLHSAIVELVALKGAHIRYVTIQNWSKNVYNLVTQRAHVAENARVEWIDANIGSKINMKYPSIYLMGKGASGEVLSIALAGEGQVQDSGGKIYHLAPNTTSKIISKSVSKGSGVSTFRGLLHIGKNAADSKSHVSCDALLLDGFAKTNTFPYNQINRSDAIISHEAKIGKISDEMIFYLMSRGISEDDAVAMIVLGFIEDLTKILPMEYSLELKRLIKLDTSGGVG